MVVGRGVTPVLGWAGDAQQVPPCSISGCAISFVLRLVRHPVLHSLGEEGSCSRFDKPLDILWALSLSNGKAPSRSRGGGGNFGEGWLSGFPDRNADFGIRA